MSLACNLLRSSPMDSPGVREFLSAIERSGVAGDRLPSFHKAIHLETVPETAAEILVREGLLTTFQAKQLLVGKWRGFTIAGKYRLLEPIGAGGMGQVFVCEHIRMRNLVAIKMLTVGRIGGPATVERFDREARAAAAFNHPNLVRAFDVDEADGIPFIVMEFVHGACLQRLGKLDPTRAIDYARQAALGLAHAHAAGLVHRDMKPGNLLVDAGGRIKVLDLGLARFAADPLDRLTDEQNRDAILGTADYLSPEQAIDSTRVDLRADIYSLGCTLFFLLTGRPPFTGGSVAETLIRHQAHPLPVLDIPGLPDGFEEFLRRMTAKNPADRPQSAAEVAGALGEFVSGPVPPPQAEDLPALCPAVRLLLPVAGSADGSATGIAALREPRHRRRWRILTGVGVVVAAALGFAVWAAIPPGTSSQFHPLPERANLPNPFDGTDRAKMIDADTAFGRVGQRWTVRLYVRGRERDPATGEIRLYSRKNPSDLRTFAVVLRPVAIKALSVAGVREPFDYFWEAKIDVTGLIADVDNIPGRPGIEVTDPAQIHRSD